MSLSGARGLVTGGSSGIGAAAALALARRGARVVVTGRDPLALARVATSTGEPWFAADLTEGGAADDVVSEALGALGGLEFVVSNAGSGWEGPFGDIKAAEVDSLVDLNFKAPVQLARAAWPALADREGGHLVFVGSIAGLLGVPCEAVYSASKAGVASLASTLRAEGRGVGVEVSLVSPGVVDTAFFARRNQPYQRRRPRPMAPERVAEAVVACLERGQGRAVIVPAWLAIPARLRGAAPRVYAALADRFG